MYRSMQFDIHVTTVPFFSILHVYILPDSIRITNPLSTLRLLRHIAACCTLKAQGMLPLVAPHCRRVVRSAWMLRGTPTVVAGMLTTSGIPTIVAGMLAMLGHHSNVPTIVAGMLGHRSRGILTMVAMVKCGQCGSRPSSLALCSHGGRPSFLPL